MKNLRKWAEALEPEAPTHIQDWFTEQLIKGASFYPIIELDGYSPPKTEFVSRTQGLYGINYNTFTTLKELETLVEQFGLSRVAEGYEELCSYTTTLMIEALSRDYEIIKITQYTLPRAISYRDKWLELASPQLEKVWESFKEELGQELELPWAWTVQSFFTDFEDPEMPEVGRCPMPEEEAPESRVEIPKNVKTSNQD